MKTSDFYYDLPQELIAQTPLERRDGSRLMVLNRETGEIQHQHFYDLPEHLHPGRLRLYSTTAGYFLHGCTVIGSPPAAQWNYCCSRMWATENGNAWPARAEN